MSDAVTATWDFAQYQQIAAELALRTAYSRGYQHELLQIWSTDLRVYHGSQHCLGSYRNDYTYIAVLDFGNQGVAKVTIEGGSAHVSVWTRLQKDGPEIVAKIRESLPGSESVEGLVPVTFWYWGTHGPDNHVRKIPVPSWSDVEENYPPSTRERIADLVENRVNVEGGQLLLWQGEPGSGKTYCLRALISEWNDWADFHFVVDPEHFFGEHSSYMMNVLLRGEDFDSLREEGPVPDRSRWKVLVLEDSGELLATDARDRVGQALSRLLNIVDGIIGQGLRVLILITTNEELRALHPAIQRPGRCASRITFESFGVYEGQEWLEKRGGDPSVVTSQMTLSWLYAHLHERALPAEPILGFGR